MEQSAKENKTPVASKPMAIQQDEVDPTPNKLNVKYLAYINAFFSDLHHGDDHIWLDDEVEISMKPSLANALTAKFKSAVNFPKSLLAFDLGIPTAFENINPMNNYNPNNHPNSSYITPSKNINTVGSGHHMISSIPQKSYAYSDLTQSNTHYLNNNNNTLYYPMPYKNESMAQKLRAWFTRPTALSGPHIILFTICTFPIAFIVTFCVSLYYSFLMMYNFYEYYFGDGRHALYHLNTPYKIVLLGLLLLSAPFIAIACGIFAGLWSAVCQLTGDFSVWHGEFFDFEKGFFGWLCTVTRMPHLCPYDITLARESRTLGRNKRRASAVFSTSGRVPNGHFPQTAPLEAPKNSFGGDGLNTFSRNPYQRTTTYTATQEEPTTRDDTSPTVADQGNEGMPISFPYGDQKSSLITKGGTGLSLYPSAQVDEIQRLQDSENSFDKTHLPSDKANSQEK